MLKIFWGKEFVEEGKGAAYPSFFRRGTQLIWEIVVVLCGVVIKGGMGKGLSSVEKMVLL